MSSRRLRPALALLALAAGPSWAGDRPWTTDDILALKLVTDANVSPDGHAVAYVVESLNAEKDAYQTDVWLVPTAGGEARALASSTASDDNPRWSPDGRVLAFLSERPRPGATGDDAAEARRQIWLIRPDGGEAELLTSAPGAVSAFEWSADGRTIGFLAREPKSEARRKRDKEKDDAWTPSDNFAWNRLWVIDVASRQARQLTRGETHVSGLSLSPDGKRVAYAAQPTPLVTDNFRSELYVVPASGGEATTLVAQKGLDGEPAWSPDGKWIAFVSQAGRDEEWYTNSYVCVVPAGGGPSRNLTTALDESIGGLFGSRVTWTPDSRALLFPAGWRTAGRIYRTTLDGQVTPLTSGPSLDNRPSIDAKGETVVFLREDSTSPREVWMLGRGGGVANPPAAPKRLTDTNPQARELQSFPKEVVSWKGARGEEIEGLLVYPTGYAKSQRVPLMLNVHGGPAGTHSMSFTPAARLWGWPLFAQAGYAIFFPNPRGSGAYGEAFRSSNVGDWGVSDYEDLMKGVDALVERGIADPERLAVSGWSYGGFMTSTIVTRTDRFKAAIVGAAVTNLASFTGTTDIPDFSRSYFRKWPWEDPTAYVQHSALFRAGNVKTPSLVVHGEKDDRVPISQGYEFYGALRARGVPTDMLVLPRQPHGPREPKLLRTCQDWIFRWTEKYTRGRGQTPAFPDRDGGMR